ncbi:DUF1800 family protein [Nakamurella sp. YIM 132087]|uniref:DUF1800 family protein n=1 Tax=Nakamurella alba TaxID=2665158 RepID=A0A7K1FKA5_9ACTN|nr:DUF1800 domain-containing protein [Nakamurella alba]MTD13849.1 DUF1800 family protein [Nakamurella alba]
MSAPTLTAGAPAAATAAPTPLVAAGAVPSRPTRSQAFHLLSRFSYGATTATLNYVTKYGAEAWWNDQVSRGKLYPGYSASPRVAATGTLLNKTPAQVRAWQKSNGNEYGWDLMNQVTRVTLGLQAFSNSQLYETVVDFFANHLNVANHADDQTWVRHTMDRDVIRKHAFGTFTDMLLASARNPAMLSYLNLADSTKSMINENYGRELLELHTVGIGAGYNEAMVKASSKVLTGRTLERDQSKATYMTYVYKPERHWTGRVTILGWTHPNTNAADGQAVGDSYLRYLAKHPSTAKNLARKLCIRFVSDTPSQALIDSVAAAYTANGTAILPTVRAIFTSAEFWASAYKKVRRPAENLYATLRILDGRMGSDPVKTLDTLWWMTRTMGNVPLEWAPPNGYPDVAGAWRSSSNLLSMWQYHRGLAQNWWKEAFVVPPTTALYPATRPRTSGEAIRVLNVRLLGNETSATQQAALQEFLGEPASTLLDNSMLRWYLDHLVPLILDGPRHGRR